MAHTTAPGRVPRPAAACLALAALAVLPPAAAAQPAGQAARIHDVFDGDCAVVVDLPALAARAAIQLQLNLAEVETRIARPGVARLEFALDAPVEAGSALRVLRGGEPVAAATVRPRDGSRPPAGACEDPGSGDEESFAAFAYLGLAIDTFAPDTVGNYRNPDASTRKTREIFGINFDYRLFGRDEDGVQLWLFGETLHGVRTADIDCEDPKGRPPVCDRAASFPDRARYILTHASTLEAFVSPRLELKTIQRHSESPAKWYVTGRFGFVALEDAPRVFRTFQLGTGLLAADGPFGGSWLEVGAGSNELLGSRRFNRLKIDAFLTFNADPFFGTDSARFFIQLFVDNDLGGGPDSIQTFFGIDVDVRKFFGK